MIAPRNRILVGDALDRVRQLPDDSVDCVVTSPPYFRLRDYGHADQLGLEAHVDRWVDQLQQLMSELRRVLVPTGTIWLNLGDSYSVKPAEGAARKSLLLGPERLTLRLLDDGWLVRNKIVWAKTNTVPTSVTDRLATKHEFIYVLARSPRYFFDLDAVREPQSAAHRNARRRRGQHHGSRTDPPGWDRTVTAIEDWPHCTRPGWWAIRSARTPETSGSWPSAAIGGRISRPSRSGWLSA